VKNNIKDKLQEDLEEKKLLQGWSDMNWTKTEYPKLVIVLEPSTNTCAKANMVDRQVLTRCGKTRHGEKHFKQCDGKQGWNFLHHTHTKQNEQNPTIVYLQDTERTA
jgi:hypothetical protein